MSLIKKIRYYRDQYEKGYYSVWKKAKDHMWCCNGICMWSSICNNTNYYEDSGATSLPFTISLYDKCIRLRMEKRENFYPIYISPKVLGC